MFDYPTALLVIAPLVILVAYVVFGLGGFGSAIVAGPVLAHFLPLTFVVPLMVLLDFMASLFVGQKSLRHVNRPEIKRLLPFMFIGIVLGVAGEPAAKAFAECAWTVLRCVRCLQHRQPGHSRAKRDLVERALGRGGRRARRAVRHGRADLRGLPFASSSGQIGIARRRA